MARVLIVDDEPDILAGFESFLTHKGYSVRTACDGPEALQQLEAQHPHAVLLDIHLPTVDGLEVLRQIRAAAPEVHVIMVSAYLDLVTREMATMMGAQGYLQKPVMFKDLDSLLARTLTSSS